MEKIAIFDLDGTLADTQHRSHYLQSKPKNWPAFNAECVNDTIISATRDVLVALSNLGYTIWVWTGRSDEYRAVTQEFIRDNGLYSHVSKLKMRPESSSIADTELKLQWFHELDTITQHSIKMVFEDRTRMVKMWRNLGVQTYQVAEGDF